MRRVGPAGLDFRSSVRVWIPNNHHYYNNVIVAVTTYILLIYIIIYIYIYNYIYIILIARVRVQYGKIFYEHAKYFHEPKASENVA